MDGKTQKSLPLSILTGFLGSGKTTLLNKLLSDPRLGETAVLINEFGSIGLDHLLVESIDQDIVLLDSGCVCCTVQDDFSQSLETLLAKRQAGLVPQFERVLLETTGIADPGPLIQLISTSADIAPAYHFEKLITVVDALYGHGTLNDQIEAMRQVILADHLILSKTDIADPAAAAALTSRLKTLNPSASIDTVARPDDLFGGRGSSKGAHPLPGREKRHSAAKTGRHDHRFATFTVTWPEPANWDDFKDWLNALLIARGESIFRLKGLLNVIGNDRPVVIQGVQHSFHPPTELLEWPNGSPRTELVFITQDFTREAALNSLKPYFNIPLAQTAKELDRQAHG